VPWRFSDACLLLYVATAVMQASEKPSQKRP